MKKKRLTCFVQAPWTLSKEGYLERIFQHLNSELEAFHIDFMHEFMRMRDHTLAATISLKVEPADFILCIFDGQNLNVMYDLGYAHGLGRPTFIALTCDHSMMPASLKGRWAARLDINRLGASIRQLALPLESFVSGLETRDPNSRCRLFVCHRSVDKPSVDPIAAKLLGKGYGVWYDNWSIRPGDSIPDEIAMGIDESTHFIICLSSNTATSKWITKEMNTALAVALEDGKPRIIPVYLDQVGKRTVPTLLREIRGVSFYSQPFDKALQELLRGIEPPAEISTS